MWRKNPDARRVLLHQSSVYLGVEYSGHPTADDLVLGNESNAATSLFKSFIDSECETASEQEIEEAISHVAESEEYMAGWDESFLPELVEWPRLLGLLIHDHRDYLMRENLREKIFEYVFTMAPGDAAKILLQVERLNMLWVL